MQKNTKTWLYVESFLYCKKALDMLYMAASTVKNAAHKLSRQLLLLLCCRTDCNENIITSRGLQ